MAAKPQVPGLVKGLGVTFKTLAHTVKPKKHGWRRQHGAVPAREGGAADPRPRRHRPARGQLHRRACCAPAAAPTGASTSRATRQLAPPRRAGGAPRKVNNLDRFDIDYALCMYCGICVEVCPFDALFWSPEYEYSEPQIADLLHDKTKLGEWMETVPEAPELEAGADKKGKK